MRLLALNAVLLIFSILATASVPALQDMWLWAALAQHVQPTVKLVLHSLAAQLASLAPTLLPMAYAPQTELVPKDTLTAWTAAHNAIQVVRLATEVELAIVWPVKMVLLSAMAFAFKIVMLAHFMILLAYLASLAVLCSAIAHLAHQPLVILAAPTTPLSTVAAL